MFGTIAYLLGSSIRQGIPLLFGATGEILTEKGGHLNLGIPGIMYVGGISGIIGGYLYEHFCANPNPALCILIPLLATIIGSGLMALIFSFLTVTLRANQNVTGLTLTTFGIGIGNFFGASLLSFFGDSGSISLLTIGGWYKAKLIPFLDFGFLAYLAVIIAIAVSFYLNRTRAGLNMRAVGENPATADAAGINVTKYQYLSTIIGGIIAGLGGLYWVMDYTGGTWTNNGFGDRGWLAIAIVIFALWKPVLGIFCSFLFGGLYICCILIPGLSSAAKELITMAPYVVTILVLIITSIKNKRENQPPAHLGLNYFREDR
ncbi:MAG: ABC transporter permease [Spirochaetia bacterium]|jgi:simple sugar transport system permease protein|nr:ABC transporter permease [Spirochaetia bacterium]